MLGLNDLLTLRHQNTATKVLKPRWDVLADYVILVMLLISVVNAVVSLYAKDPVCVPAVKCPGTGNSSSENAYFHKICDAYYSTYQSKRNVVVSDIIYTTTSEDRNLFNYINSKCKTKRFEVNWFSVFFPTALFLEAGACLIAHNIWLNFGALICDHFSLFVKDCYDSFGKKLTESEQEVKISQFAELQKLIRRPRNEHTVRCLYGLELVLQVVTLLTCITLNLSCKRFEVNFRCNVDEIIPGLTFDYLTCSHSLPKFYEHTFWWFLALLIVLLLVSIRRFAWFVSRCCSPFHWKKPVSFSISKGDFAFLLHLLKASNPLYLESLKLFVARYSVVFNQEYV